jgi:hypothetical protein
MNRGRSVRPFPDPRRRRRAGSLVMAALLTAALATGCAARAGADPDAPTDEEKVLLDRLARDNFVHITDLLRNDEGYLVVTTRQGDTYVRYLLSPANEATRQLTIHRLVETLEVVEGPDAGPVGTGPAPRGLAHESLPPQAH